MASVIQSDILSTYLDRVLEAKRKGHADDLYIVDIREEWERKEYDVPFSLVIPAKEARELPKMSSKEFQQRYGAEKPKRNSYILVVCDGGRRSVVIKQFLLEKGFKHVFALTDGLDHWREGKANAYDEDL